MYVWVFCVLRERIFKQGGVLSITSRILIVDMLNAKIELANITGIVVLHAEEYVHSLHRFCFSSQGSTSEPWCLSPHPPSLRYRVLPSSIMAFIAKEKKFSWFYLLFSIFDKERIHQSVLRRAGTFHLLILALANGAKSAQDPERIPVAKVRGKKNCFPSQQNPFFSSLKSAHVCEKKRF
jgi:hypothetical protein